jgi:serine/threonine-protein kinase
MNVARAQSLRDALDFLEPGAALRGPLFASLLDRLAQAPPELAPGARIGPYEVRSALGRGGTAVVYLAERVDGEFEQQVALKLVPTGREADAARALLRRERQILASLRHPGIARLLDGGTTDGGLLWFAMEPIFGERIDRWCAGRPLAERLRLFVEVCRAVEFAHARLLVHRDLKPANILVTAAGEPRLLDFGIAALLERADSASSTPAALTPGFASPEQVRGAAPATASDIWQLGRLLEAMCADAPALLRTNADLHAIVARARHELPAQRYATVHELIDDVERLLDARPVLARGGGPAYRAARFVSRHRVVSALAAIAALLLVTMAAVFTVRLARERDAAHAEAARAEAATQFMIDLVRVSDPSVSRGSALTARELLAHGTARLRNGELASDPAVRARLLQAIGQSYLALGDAALADPLLAEAAAILERLPAADATTLATVLHTQAIVALQLGRPGDALALLARAEPGFAGDTPQLAKRRLELLGLRAMALLGSARIDESLHTQQQAVALAEALTGAYSVETAGAVHDLGIVQRAIGRRDEALASFERAYAISLRVRGADHPDTVKAQKSVATLLVDMDDLVRGAPMLEDAVERQRRLFGADGALYGSALRALGELHLKTGEHARARDELVESERLIRAAIGPDGASLAYTQFTLAEAHAALGEHEAALAAARDALRIRKRLRPPGNPEIARSEQQVAAQLAALGRSG